MSDDPIPPKKIIFKGKLTPSIMSVLQSHIASGALKMDDIEFQDYQTREEKAKECLEEVKSQIEWEFKPSPYVRDTLQSEQKGIPFKRTEPKIGRNQLCPCGSLKKYKHCCLNK